jgi:hypothetical protein
VQFVLFTGVSKVSKSRIRRGHVEHMNKGGKVMLSPYFTNQDAMTTKWGRYIVTSIKMEI